MTSVTDLSDIVSRLIRSQEAIVDGDPELALAVLADLERDLTPRGPAYSCDSCGSRFPWPGELRRHEDVTGHGALEEAA
jgi:hypothetical protein